MTVEHLPATATGDDIAVLLERDGCCVIDRIVDGEVMDRARSELAPHLDATAPGTDDFSGHATRRTGALLARSATCRDLVTHPTIRAAVAKALGHASGHQLHLTQLIAIGPGQGGQPVHRDQWAFDFFPFPNGFEVQTNTIWAMTDFTEHNGATRVIPGSHRFEDKQQFAYADTEPAEMEKGSVLVYTGALYHGGGANASDATRIGVNITYNLSWLRQEENQYLSVPREIAATFDEDLLRLMGYARGAYALGYIDDLRDPIEAIRPDLGRSGFGDAKSEDLDLDLDSAGAPGGAGS